MTQQNHLQKFGSYIKELREENGFPSQRSLSEKIGVSNSTVAKIERGAHVASEETLEKLANVFNVSYLDLVKKQDEYNESDKESLVERIQKLSMFQLGIIHNILGEFLGGKGEESLEISLGKLPKARINMVSNLVDEFLKLGGKVQ
ncbi:helix-turn-helix domain-containing protein [Peribacillus asahii]|uniref:helix-turn-helix domain-containing protein n=1 Tax=Peribacillus asahii TaxID=228899 RepID=UPI00381F861B